MTDRITVPKELIYGSPEDNYILHVIGDGHSEYGILDGDLIAVYRTEKAHRGELVIANNSLFIYRGDTQIEGIVVGLMRRYGRATSE